MKWAKLLRRTLALCFAILAVWWLAGARSAVAVEGVARQSAGVWEEFVMTQSPYLQAARVLSTPLDLPSSPPSASPPPAVSELTAPEEDGDEPPLPSQTPGVQSVVAQTLLPPSDGSYPSSGGVFLYNRTSQAVDMDQLAQANISLTGEGNGPRILIIHTHATEAYTQDGQDIYEESDPYRTVDDAHNVVRVGDEMAAAFARAGLNVLHDRTLHDYPNYNGAYTRSRQTVEEYLAAYPSISVVLDVHRDALVGEDGTVYKVMADESVLPDTAQVMLVVGTQEAGGSHTNWRQNLSFAIALERALNEHQPTLARPITLRTSHFNQQLSPGSLLVEVGTNGNTLQEAIAAAQAFAQTTAPVIAELIP